MNNKKKKSPCWENLIHSTQARKKYVNFLLKTKDKNDFAKECLGVIEGVFVFDEEIQKMRKEYAHKKIQLHAS